MYNVICKLFIKDYDKIKDSKVRERYGTVFSIFSILCNLILVVIKLVISFFTNSVAIKTDAFNNLSDLGSNTATLIGFKMSSKHADADHPYGHGRMEYVSGMVVSFLILHMGFDALTESVNGIFHPEQISDSTVTYIALGVSVAVKYLMGVVNNKAGNSIDSDTLKAAGQDSVNDCLVTGSTILSMLVFHFFNINVDAYVGVFVSLMVLKSGAEIFKNMLDLVIGKAPDKYLVKEIERLVNSFPHVLGIHDMILHDYGPNGKIMSLHAEVDSTCDVLEIHDEIDIIEAVIKEKYNILTTIHMDPIVMNDEEINAARKMVLEAVRSVNPEYNIHDFRMVKGQTHTNLIFDVLLPANDRSTDREVREKIAKKVTSINESYFTVIQVDRSFV